MIDSTGMKLVFRLHGVGFALPLGDLIEVGEGLSGLLRPLVAAEASAAVGMIEHRGVEIPLLDLGACLDFAAVDLAGVDDFLVLAGADHPWALAVDQVVGVFPAPEFTLLPAPVWYFRESGRPFRVLTVWREEPLILCEALPFEQMLVAQ